MTDSVQDIAKAVIAKLYNKPLGEGARLGISVLNNGKMRFDALGPPNPITGQPGIVCTSLTKDEVAILIQELSILMDEMPDAT